MISNRFLKDELHGLSVSARVVPIIFMSIAALILFVLLNRMVRNERTQIGLMKAYGYSDFSVAIHYIQYALLLTLGGCIIGFIGGQLLSKLLVEALYAEFYIFPNLRAHVYSEVVLKSTAIARPPPSPARSSPRRRPPPSTPQRPCARSPRAPPTASSSRPSPASGDGSASSGR
jgi:hypothetical protein